VARRANSIEWWVALSSRSQDARSLSSHVRNEEEVEGGRKELEGGQKGMMESPKYSICQSVYAIMGSHGHMTVSQHSPPRRVFWV